MNMIDINIISVYTASRLGLQAPNKANEAIPMLSTPCESVQVLTDIPRFVENYTVIKTALKLKLVE